MLCAHTSQAKLRKLIFKNCQLDAACAVPLAKFLAAAPTNMYEAYLNGNAGLGGAASVIFDALAANNAAGLQLTAVSMPGCGITDEAAGALEQLLLAGKVELVELNLQNNALSEGMKARLRTANELAARRVVALRKSTPMSSSGQWPPQPGAIQSLQL